MSWSSRRQFAYMGTAALIVLLFAGVYVYAKFFDKAPTCFDGKQNGDETGVDCGGSCALLCKGDAHAPIVLWTRALQVATGTYTAVAYIENPQGFSAGARNVQYDFKLLDANNQLVLETPPQLMTLPPMQTIPVVLPNVNTGSGVVAHAFFQFLGDVTWTKFPQGSMPAVRIVDQNLAPDGTRLTATIVNDGTSDIQNLTVNAVLFDAQDTAVAASKSVVARVPHGSSVPVIFTWPQPVPNVARAELIPVPSL